MVFSRFLEWKEESQIGIAKLEMFHEQCNSESQCFSLSPKGWGYTDPYSYSGTHIHFLGYDDKSIQGVQLQEKNERKWLFLWVYWIYLFTRQTCPLWQNLSLAEKCITIHHLLREKAVVNKFHGRTGFSETKKCQCLRFIQTAAVTENNQAELWLIVQQPTPSISH